MPRRMSMPLLLAALALPTLLQAAEQKGWFGLGFDIESEGFSLNPTLVAVRIHEIKPGSPAAGAGLLAGDVIASVQGIVVAGAKADRLKQAMDHKVGEALDLEIVRGNSPPRHVTLVAAAKR